MIEVSGNLHDSIPVFIEVDDNNWLTKKDESVKEKNFIISVD